MKKSWKTRLADEIAEIATAVIVVMMMFCALVIWLCSAFIVSLICGIEALTDLVLWLLVIPCPLVVVALLAFICSDCLMAWLEREVQDEAD